MPDTRRFDLLRLVAAIAVCQAAGGIGALATANSVSTWYVTLKKAPLNPPPWVFGPAWTTLYTLMGIALYRAWMRSRRTDPAPLGAGESATTEDGVAAAGTLRRASFTPFWVQLALNASWSLVFFGLREPLGALFTLVAMQVGILATIRSFARVDRAAVWLLAPYAAWVTFAGYLNASVWWLNRQ
ncbi:MAG: TspO/MBR family protein [Chloroflexota bacterium]